MSVQLAKPIKQQILVNLAALVTAGKLNSYYAVDESPNPLTIQPSAGYPFAIVAMPKIASDFEDQASNQRTYRFDILFVLDPSTMQNRDTDVEDFIDAILNQFDTEFTLEGTATAAVLPAHLEGAPVSTGDKQLLALVLTLEARTLYTTGT
ncbi:MAG TPA: hypothetical protein VKW08_00350 [Xanthobacteraceae bacterium]|jgi:hypothetical protein|nr:hypothetical protein [Xanthobacteraceae bacterium]